jgi:plastocyanin
MKAPSMRRFWLIIAITGWLLPSASQASTVSVLIKNYAFSPPQVLVHPGDIVVWTNRDDVAHTVTAFGKQFSSGVLDPGQSFRFTFKKTGLFRYRCAIHPEMLGTVTVKPAP